MGIGAGQGTRRSADLARGVGGALLLGMGWVAAGLGLAAPGSAQTQDWMRARILSARTAPAMAYDEARQRVVLFGGGLGTGSPLAGGIFFNDTWEWDGTSWLERTPATRPPGRWMHGMAYDAARKQVVVFGGADGAGYRNDTWLWDGVSWTQAQPTGLVPSQRSAYTLAYDAARQQVVLFGGYNGRNPGTLNDTWTWDGKNWTNSTPSSISPGVRSNHALVYDAARQVVVLFGGVASNTGPFLNDTWTWDGSKWMKQAPLTTPPARYWHGFAYDPGRQVAVMFGGSTGNPVNETWEWNGTTWFRPPATSSPLACVTPAMAYDGVRQRILLFGGAIYGQGSLTSSFIDTWAWDGTNWSLAAPAASPPARRIHAMAADRARQQVVLFGGESLGKNLLADTWEWGSGGWVQLQPAISPPGRRYHGLAYDEQRQETILFGGLGQNYLADTWTWNGASWAQPPLSASPSARSGHALAYDAGRQRVVLFSGGGWTGNIADTWEWDGVNWTQCFPATSPPARMYHAMAYDRARQKVVLFGGLGAAGIFADYWEWNGVNWKPMSLLPPIPPARYGHALAFDEGRGCLVLFGGKDANGQNLADTWENWVQVSPATSPMARLFHTLAYDYARGRLLLFGGETSTTYAPVLDDTWLYGRLIRATAIPFGTGCLGANGVPILTGNEPSLCSSGFLLDLLAARGAAPCVLGLSDRSLSLPIGGGCTLYLNVPFVPLVTLANVNGFASFILNIPGDPALRGVSLFAQGFVVDPGAALGIAFSQGCHLRLGD